MNITKWHYEREDIPQVTDDLESAAAAHAKAVLAIDYWANELKYMNHWAKGYDDGRKLLAKWKECKQKAATVIKAHQLTLF